MRLFKCERFTYTGVKHGVCSITPPENIIKFNALHSTRALISQCPAIVLLMFILSTITLFKSLLIAFSIPLPVKTGTNLLRATRGARNPNLQVAIARASYVCSQQWFGLPLRMNVMHRTQYDQARLDLLSLVIWLRVLWLSLTWNLVRKAKWFWPSIVVSRTP